MRGKPPGRTCTPKTSDFPDKNLQEISSSELFFTSTIFAGDNIPCFPLTVPSHVRNLTHKCKILNVFWA